MTHDIIYILLNISNLYADTDARSMIPSRKTRSYTVRSVPSFPGRSFIVIGKTVTVSGSGPQGAKSPRVVLESLALR